jgi:hypothetical protein
VVPPGFAISVDGYRMLWRRQGLVKRSKNMEKEFDDTKDVAQQLEASKGSEAHRRKEMPL